MPVKECIHPSCEAHAPRNAATCSQHRDYVQPPPSGHYAFGVGSTSGGSDVIITGGDTTAGTPHSGDIFIRGGSGGGPGAGRIVAQQWSPIQLESGGGSDELTEMTGRLSSAEDLIRQQVSQIAELERNMERLLEAAQPSGLSAGAESQVRTFDGDIEMVSVHGGRLTNAEIVERARAWRRRASNFDDIVDDDINQHLLDEDILE